MVALARRCAPQVVAQLKRAADAEAARKRAEVRVGVDVLLVHPCKSDVSSAPKHMCVWLCFQQEEEARRKRVADAEEAARKLAEVRDAVKGMVTVTD
jgi:hypothetical protein